MQLVEAARICSSLRCQRCHRAPTSQEVQEMVGDFGHKLDETDVGATLKAGNASCLIWLCGPCRERPLTRAEKRAMQAERWEEWKRGALKTMSQQEIDELEVLYTSMAATQEKAIKTGKCPECGCALGEKPDFAGRPFTNIFCAAPRPAGTAPHFLIGVDNDELRELRAS
jgi:hypothetical protein